MIETIEKQQKIAICNMKTIGIGDGKTHLVESVQNTSPFSKSRVDIPKRNSACESGLSIGEIYPVVPDEFQYVFESI